MVTRETALRAASEIVHLICQKLDHAEKHDLEGYTVLDAYKEVLVALRERVCSQAFLYRPRLCHKRWCTGGPPFVVIELPQTDQPAGELYIDLCFRQRWMIPRSTKEYDTLLSSSNAAFVGPADALRSRLTVMAEALRKVFSRKGLDLPPWRTRSAAVGLYNFRESCLREDVAIHEGSFSESSDE